MLLKTHFAGREIRIYLISAATNFSLGSSKYRDKFLKTEERKNKIMLKNSPTLETIMKFIYRYCCFRFRL